MKRYTAAALVFVLTAALLTGCMGTNDSQGATTAPTILPTTEAPTTMPTVETTLPVIESTESTMHTEATEPSATETVGEDGVVGSDPTDDTGVNSRSRKVPMGR